MKSLDVPYFSTMLGFYTSASIVKKVKIGQMETITTISGTPEHIIDNYVRMKVKYKPPNVTIEHAPENAYCMVFDFFPDIIS